MYSRVGTVGVCSTKGSVAAVPQQRSATRQCVGVRAALPRKGTRWVLMRVLTRVLAAHSLGTVGVSATKGVQCGRAASAQRTAAVRGTCARHHLARVLGGGYTRGTRGCVQGYSGALEVFQGYSRGTAGVLRAHSVEA
jgi:hypothetical protein